MINIRRQILCAVLFAAIIHPGVASADTGPFVNPDNGNSYYVTEAMMTWADAEAWAISKGGLLAAINSAVEDAWMQGALGLGTGYYWLGGSDAATEGLFVWSTGEPFTYQDFLPGEPDDDSGSGADHVALDVINWGWLDTSGSFVGFVTGAIAEVPAPTGVGAPSAAVVELVARPSVTSDFMRLSFALPSASSTRVRIYDASGRLVRTLAAGTLGPGAHELTWDTRNDAAQRVPSGVYFVQLQVDRTSSTRKVVVTR